MARVTLSQKDSVRDDVAISDDTERVGLWGQATNPSVCHLCSASIYQAHTAWQAATTYVTYIVSVFSPFGT